MNKTLYSLVLLLVSLLTFSTGASAQDAVLQNDTLVSVAPAVDSTLIGVDPFVMVEAGDNIRINQSSSVEEAFGIFTRRNLKKELNGFRIRIFFDNKQSARVQSEEVEKAFIEAFPQYPVYRSYTNPYFKVAVGDFRSKSEAIKVLKEIAPLYEKAFIIKDVINYPR